MKLKISVLIFFLAAANFVFAKAHNVGSDNEYIKKCGPVPPAFYEAYKRQNPQVNPVGKAMAKMYDHILHFLGVRSRYRHYDPLSKCKANQRILVGAIEMYNMDHREVIDDITDSGAYNSMQLLMNGYLKSPLYCDNGGKYRSYGPLSEDGIVYCDYHGPVEVPFGNLIKPTPIWVQVIQVILIMLVFSLFIVLLFKFVIKFVKKSPDSPDSPPIC